MPTPSVSPSPTPTPAPYPNSTKTRATQTNNITVNSVIVNPASGETMPTSQTPNPPSASPIAQYSQTLEQSSWIQVIYGVIAALITVTIFIVVLKIVIIKDE